MTQIPSTRVDWVKTQTNLAKYSSNDKMWLRRVVTSEGEFLEAKKSYNWYEVHAHFWSVAPS